MLITISPQKLQFRSKSSTIHNKAKKWRARKEEDDDGCKYVTMKWREAEIIVLSLKKKKDF